jgi:hypothetical protein
MTSNINVNFPVDNVDVSKQLMRDQFATIKTEIDQLQAGSFPDYTQNGFMVYNNVTNSTVGRSIQGTAGQINVTNNNGVDGNVVISLVTNPVITNPTINGATINSSTIGSTTPAAGTFTTINGIAPATAQYTTAEESKLAGIEAGADVTDTSNVLAALVGQDVALVSINGVTAPTAQYTTAEESKLAGIEASADVTDSTNVLAALVGQNIVATSYTGTVDGVVGGNTPAAGTFTTINGVTPATAQYTTAEESKLAGIETGADVTDSTNVLAALVGQEVVATGFTGTLDGILGGGEPAAATVTAFTSNGIDDNSSSTAITIDSDGSVSLAGSSSAAVGVLTDGATITPNFDTYQNFSVTLGGNRILANPSSTLVPGQAGVIFITQDGTGSRTLAYGTYWDFAGGGTAPTLSTTAGAVDALYYYVRTTTSIFAKLETGYS